jgi:hypothetical protein
MSPFSTHVGKYPAEGGGDDAFPHVRSRTQHGQAGSGLPIFSSLPFKML